jgi:hypothetical protein
VSRMLDDGRVQVVLTKSTRGNVTLLDYFVRLAADKGRWLV